MRAHARRGIHVIVAATTLVPSTPAWAGSVRYVDDLAAAGGDGLSWQTAYRFLQDAMIDAANGPLGGVTEIRVAQGRYLPDRDEANPAGTGDRTATFQLLDGVALRGGYLGLAAGKGEDPDDRDIDLYETILSGDLAGDDVIMWPVQYDNGGENSFHVASAAGTRPDALIEGFTIRQGYDVETAGSAGLLVDDGDATITRCTFVLNVGGNGGAIRILTGTPAVTDCVFINNQGGEGAGIYIDATDPTIDGCSFIDNIGAAVGGGISIREGSPLLVDCVFDGNVSGLYAGAGVSNFFGSPTLTGCVFIANDALRFGGGLHSSGGDILVESCVFDGNVVSEDGFGGGMAFLGDARDPVTATVVDCTFTNNVASQAGGGYANTGAGATSVLAGCTIDGNTGNAGGGGVWNDGTITLVDTDVVSNVGMLGGGGAANAGVMTVVSCVVRDNAAQFISGGGIFSNGATQSLAVANTVFTGNTANDEGGAIWAFGGLTVSSSTFWSNAAGLAGGAVFNDGAEAHVGNSILWQNASGPIGGPATVVYSDVEGGWPGPGNIDADPLFADAPGGDLRLEPGSACLDAGNNWALPADDADLDGDGDTGELLPLDLDAGPRVAADEQDFDPGCGIPAVTDMGAYEREGGPAVIVFADVDGDGVVGITDLLQLLACWGPADPACCLADLDVNDAIGINDLLLMLASWG